MSNFRTGRQVIPQKTIHAGHPDLPSQTARQMHDMQRHANEVTVRLEKCPFISGNLLDKEQDANGKTTTSLPGSGLAFTATQTRTLTHGLGRVPNGWFVMRAFGAGPVLLAEVSPAPSSSTITLANSLGAPGSVFIWVF
jgi:hypothetical protein